MRPEYCWRGKPIEHLSREELIEALTVACDAELARQKEAEEYNKFGIHISPIGAKVPADLVLAAARHFEEMHAPSGVGKTIGPLTPEEQRALGVGCRRKSNALQRLIFRLSGGADRRRG